MSTGYLVILAICAIITLLTLVMVLKWPAYVALLAVSVVTALLSGISIDEVMSTVIEGMGSTLGSVALLVGLGAMLGGIIEKTGGAQVVTRKAAEILGERRLAPAFLIASGLIAIPIFFDVAYIILVPIIFSFAKSAGHRNPVILGAPVAATMVYIHNTVPPHPGVTGSTTLLRADVLGLVTLLGICLTIPVGLVVYMAAKKVTAREFDLASEVAQKYDDTHAANLSIPLGSPGISFNDKPVTYPTAGEVVAVIVLPILMIAAGTIGHLITDESSTVYRILSLVGAPGFALIVASILAMLVLGRRHSWPRLELADLMDRALGPAAVVVFVTGAGGVFAKVLTESGIGATVSNLLIDAGVPILFLAFLVALCFKVAQGSGTVATLAAAGLIQSSVLSGDFSNIQVALIILAIGMGSVSLSHINDSGFWIATRFLGLDIGGGLRTWTILCTVAGFTGMALVSLMWLIV